MGDGVTSIVDGLDQKNLLTYISQLPKYPASACAKAIKRDLFLKHDLLFEPGLISEDLEWALRLFLSAGSAGYCCEDYYFYRQSRRNSLSSQRSEKKALDTLYIVEKWMGDLKNHQEKEEKQLIRSQMEYVFRFLIINLTYVPAERKNEYKQRVRKCDIVLGQRRDRVSKLIRITYKMCGINITNRMLRCYLGLQKRYICH